MDVSGVGLSLHQAVKDNASRIATRTLTADGKLVAAEVTWAELERKVGLLTSILERTPALRRGDRLGVLGRNSAEYLQLLYACADAGVIIVPLNTRWSVQELRHAVVDCGIKVMAVLDQDFVGTALELSMPAAPAPTLTPTPATAASPGISSLLLGPHATDFRSASSTPPSELSLGLSSEVSAEPSADLSAELSVEVLQQWRVLPLGGIDHAGSAISLERRLTYAAASELTSVSGDEAQEGRDLDEPRCRDSAESAGSAKLNVAEMAGDIYCIVHTSGSTGRSKGVALTHRGQVLQATAKCVHIGLNSSSTFLNVMPLFHVGGISASLAVTMVAGCHVFMPRFSSATGRAAVRTGRVNYLVAVPTILHMLMNETSNGAKSRSSGSDSVAASAGAAGASPLAGVLVVVVGGQLMSRRLERLGRDRMPKARFVQTYACTEAGSTITFAASPPLVRDSGCVEVSEAHLARGSSKIPGVRNTARDNFSAAGAAGGITAETEKLGVRSTARDNGPALGAAGGITAEHVEVRIVERGSTDGRRAYPAAPGVIGEVETRGPHVMEGYWGRPDLTAGALRSDGWLRTGDLGRLDEGTGRLLVVGRVKDMIKTGGENVHASEVEDVLLRHNWVAEAAAYGVNDERLGETVAASVVLDDAAKDQAGAVTCDRAKTVLDKFCGLHLSHYKRPRRIYVVPALPRNSAGKVLRHQLRASL